MQNNVPAGAGFLTIGGLLEHSAEKYGDKTAIKYAERSVVHEISYRDLFRDAKAAAGYIDSVLAGPCHAAMIGRTDYRYVTFMNGLFVSGKVFVPMSPDYDCDKLAALLDDSDIELLIYDKKQREKIDQIRPRLKKVKAYIDLSDDAVFDAIGSFAPDRPFAPVDPDSCAVIMYTSGTMGDFKGVMLSHRGIILNVKFEEWDLDRENVTLSVLPMHHIFCFACDYLKNINDGVTICLNVDIGSIYRNLLLFEPTIMRLVPMIIESLANRIRIVAAKHPEYTPREAAEAVVGRRLTNILSAGAPLVGGLAPLFESMGIRIRQGYGMTEVGARLSVPDEKTDPHSGGRVISICTARVKDGEVQVRTPSIFMGYYKKPEQTAEMFTPDGWFRTGDLGYITPDREVFIRGRIKNLIILSNGENVSPEEIEKYYADEPLIKEMMVYEEDGAIAACIRPDFDLAAETGVDDVIGAVNDIVARVNSEHESTREITKIYIREKPFERTGPGKIIRNEANKR